MKTRSAGLITTGLLSLGMLLSPVQGEVGITIAIGDRPYYEGPVYWNLGYEYVWVPGHWGNHHRWIHGHYAKRGNFHPEHAKEHHKGHPHQD
jgi:hypothetical protein